MEIAHSILSFWFGGFHIAFKLSNKSRTRVPIRLLEDRVPLVVTFKLGKITTQLEEFNSNWICINAIFLDNLVIR